MIEIKESYGFGFRLYDSETGKYIQNNADNRSRALFCALLQNEANKGKAHKEKHSVEEIANVYENALIQSKCDNLNEAVDGFLFFANHQLDLDKKGFYKNENLIRLIYLVMNDQKDEKKQTGFDSIQAMANDYKFMNKKILGKAEEKIL